MKCWRSGLSTGEDIKGMKEASEMINPKVHRSSARQLARLHARFIQPSDPLLRQLDKR